MRCYSKLTNKKGFTLIEVVVSMFILSGGLLLLLPMMVVSMQSNDLANGFTEASMMIKGKMEELKNIDNPVSGADSIGTSYRTWTITQPESNLLRMVVNINWTDIDGGLHTNSMVSYMMKN